MPVKPVQMGSGSSKKDPPAVFVDPKAAKPKGPVPSPPTPPAARSKKKATKKKAKKATKKKAAAKGPRALAPPSNPSPPKHKPGKSKMVPVQREVDPKNLEPEDAKKRCAAIYKRERKVEGKRVIHELAKKTAKAAKAALTDAEEELEKEINDQRFGPGPLFPVK